MLLDVTEVHDPLVGLTGLKAEVVVDPVWSNLGLVVATGVSEDSLETTVGIKGICTMIDVIEAMPRQPLDGGVGFEGLVLPLRSADCCPLVIPARLGSRSMRYA